LKKCLIFTNNQDPDPHSFSKIYPDPNPHSLKTLDPDPHKVDAVKKHCSAYIKQKWLTLPLEIT
jgi:hypothetical protein